jgi:hypothetical protein
MDDGAARRRTEPVEAQRTVHGDDARPLDRVLQFAHVAGPLVGFELPQRRRAEAQQLRGGPA